MTSVESVEKAIDEDEPMNPNEEEDSDATLADHISGTDDGSEEGEDDEEEERRIREGFIVNEDEDDEEDRDAESGAIEDVVSSITSLGSHSSNML